MNSKIWQNKLSSKIIIDVHILYVHILYVHILYVHILYVYSADLNYHDKRTKLEFSNAFFSILVKMRQNLKKKQKLRRISSE